MLFLPPPLTGEGWGGGVVPRLILSVSKISKRRPVIVKIEDPTPILRNGLVVTLRNVKIEDLTPFLYILRSLVFHSGM